MTFDAVARHELDTRRAHRQRRPQFEAGATPAEEMVRRLGMEGIERTGVTIDDERLVERGVVRSTDEAGRAGRTGNAGDQSAGREGGEYHARGPPLGGSETGPLRCSSYTRHARLPSVVCAI